MNERIQELYQKAHREVVEEDIYTGMPSVELRFDPENFAQLIVGECLVDFYRRYLDTTSEEDITHQVGRYIKDYFGVES